MSEELRQSDSLSEESRRPAMSEEPRQDTMSEEPRRPDSITEDMVATIVGGRIVIRPTGEEIREDEIICVVRMSDVRDGRRGRSTTSSSDGLANDEYRLLWLRRSPPPPVDPWLYHFAGVALRAPTAGSILPSDFLDRHLLKDGFPAVFDPAVTSLHVAVSTESGTRLAFTFYECTLQPLLSFFRLAAVSTTDNENIAYGHKDLVINHVQAPFGKYHLLVTSSADSIGELGRSLAAAAATSPDVPPPTIILLSGDGGVVDLLNSLDAQQPVLEAANGDEVDTRRLPTIALLPLGTANALFHSLHKPHYDAVVRRATKEREVEQGAAEEGAAQTPGKGASEANEVNGANSAIDADDNGSHHDGNNEPPPFSTLPEPGPAPTPSPELASRESLPAFVLALRSLIKGHAVPLPNFEATFSPGSRIVRYVLKDVGEAYETAGAAGAAEIVETVETEAAENGGAPGPAENCRISGPSETPGPAENGGTPGPAENGGTPGPAGTAWAAENGRTAETPGTPATPGTPGTPGTADGTIFSGSGWSSFEAETDQIMAKAHEAAQRSAVIRKRAAEAGRGLMSATAGFGVGTLREQFTPVERLRGAIVASSAFHAQLVWESDTPEYRKHGVTRFVMIANKLLRRSHAYAIDVDIKPSALVGQGGSTSTQQHATVRLGSNFNYVLATLVSNLERPFTISPASQPLDGQLRLVNFSGVDGEGIKSIMTAAYNDGSHVNMRWPRPRPANEREAANGSGEPEAARNGGGEAVSGYGEPEAANGNNEPDPGTANDVAEPTRNDEAEAVTGNSEAEAFIGNEAPDEEVEQEEDGVGYHAIDEVTLTLREHDAWWRKICIDGTIVEVPEGGRVHVRMAAKPILKILIHDV